MSEKILGTPIVCKECGFEDKIRLFKGTKIKSLYCGGCHRFGVMMRNTEYDRQRRKENQRK